MLEKMELIVGYCLSLVRSSNMLHYSVVSQENAPYMKAKDI